MVFKCDVGILVSKFWKKNPCLPSESYIKLFYLLIIIFSKYQILPYQILFKSF